MESVAALTPRELTMQSLLLESVKTSQSEEAPHAVNIGLLKIHGVKHGVKMDSCVFVMMKHSLMT